MENLTYASVEERLKKMANLPGGTELWSQYPVDAQLAKLGQNLVRVTYLPDPAQGRERTTSQDLRVSFDGTGKACVTADSDTDVERFILPEI